MLLVPLAARADRWLMENSVNARFETNDNIALAQTSPGTANTVYLSGVLDVSRQLENAVTRLKTDATVVRQQGPAAQNRLDGQLALTQSFNDPLNTFNASIQYQQDFNNVVTNADVTQAPGRRRTTTMSAAWSRALTERLSASMQLSADRTAYGVPLTGAVDYHDVAASLGTSYDLSETAALGVQLSRSEYHAADDRNRSTTDAVSLSLSRPMSERASGSVSLGLYRTVSVAQNAGVGCPLAVALCEAGLVPFVRFEQRIDAARHGVQFNARYRQQLDEATVASFGVARQQTPSGAGSLVRNDTLSLGLRRAFSPTLGGSMNYARSRSTLQDTANAASPGQASLGASLTKQLAADLSLQFSVQRSQSDNSAFGNNGRSNSVSVSLQFNGQTIDASR